MKTTTRSRLLSVAASVLTMAVCAAPTGYGATQAQIDQAIDDGLAWLATQQNANGSFGSGYPLAYTAAAVLAFENEGNFPGGGSTYSTEVEKGLDYILANASSIPIGMQPAGDPDSNDNGIGICWQSDGRNREVYETGMIMQTLVASSSPAREVTVGPFTGKTYKQVMQDVVDWAAFGQADSGNARGGWHYWANLGTADNSTAQWPVLGLVAAEQWGISAPQFVKDELNLWINYIQNDTSGGSGYSNPNELVNESKTGGLLVQMHYVGDAATTSRAQAALGYLNNNWNSTPNTWDGNKGNPYAMFSIFKGLELMDVSTIPNAPATPDTPAKDWYGDYAEFLVNSQNDNGSWNGYSSWNNLLSTGWYVVILQATVFPVQVAIDLPDCACDSGYQFDVNYSVERFPADGTLTLFEDGVQTKVIPIENFRGSATEQIVVNSDTPGPHEWKAVLAVTGEGGVSATTEDKDTVNVCETPQVSGIPDQVSPFQTFDLDDYLSYGGALPVVWTTSGAPMDWSVTIDADNVVTVVAPEGASDPVDLTFTASVECCSGLVCSSSDVANFVPNQAPNCSGAFASTEIIWPPNHKMVPIQILGVTDPDGDPLTITIDSIRQDEPLNTVGDGNFEPDGGGLGADTAWVRAERSGAKKVPGNGRVYHISFTADDGRGGTCSCEVLVGVPHDVKKIPIDDGATFDSTALAP